MPKRITSFLGILTVVLLVTYAQSWGGLEIVNDYQTNSPILLEETDAALKKATVKTVGYSDIDITNDGNIGLGKTSRNNGLQMAEVIIRDYGVIYPDGMYQSKAWRSSINGIFFLGGNVGIGTYGPEEELDIYSEYPYVKFSGHATTDARQIGLNNYGFVVYNPDDTRYDMVIDNAGNVGIGTTSPDDDLHVANHIRVGEDPGYPHVYGELKHDGGGNGFIINANAGGGWADIHFQTNGTTRMFLESDGTLIIGGTTKLASHSSYQLQVHKSCYFGGSVSAIYYYDRTPYPKDLETAYAAVLSMERLPPGEYDENNKENQLDHSKLHEFIRSKDGNYRDLSATVSAQNEVIKDLLKRIEELEAKLD
jgi:hypothetical protein